MKKILKITILSGIIVCLSACGGDRENQKGINTTVPEKSPGDTNGSK